MQQRDPAEHEVLTRYRRGARCQEIALQLGLTVHEVVVCVLKASTGEPDLLRRVSREVGVAMPKTAGRTGPEFEPSEEPHAGSPDPSPEADPIDGPDEAAPGDEGEDEDEGVGRQSF